MVTTEVTAQFIRDAVGINTWTLGNSVLYDLCHNHPGHKHEDEIAAKIWLIGRSYAAAMERRRKVEVEAIGDDFFYKRVIPAIKNSSIDAWIQEAASGPTDQDEIALETHKKVQDLFWRITELNKRSLASKYLHFHLPNKFFLYDTRAAKALSHLLGEFRTAGTSPKHDAVYARFVEGCRKLNNRFVALRGSTLTPRDFDKVLLEYVRTSRNDN
jgi:hypothetical protein